MAEQGHRLLQKACREGNGGLVEVGKEWCKYESEWLRAHCEAEPEMVGRSGGRHSVWTLCVDGSGG